MTKKKFFGLLLIGLVALAVYDVWPATLRYRLTLTVDDNGTQKSGSGVIECIYDKEPKWIPLPSHSEWHSSVRGEAVAVDLGDRGILFSLLKQGSDSRSSADEIALKAFGFMEGPIIYPVDKRLSWISSLGKRIGARADVPFYNLPMLVRFRDINDPKTVESVDPEDLAASFGEGVKLVGATIEITDAPITIGIEKRLRWLPNRKKVIGYLGGWPEDPSKLYLNGSEFTAGVLK